MRRIVVFAFDGFQLLDLAGPVDVFDGASRAVGGDEGYRLQIATPDGGPAQSASGLTLQADVPLAASGAAIDTLLVVGGRGARVIREDDRILDAVRRAAMRARRIASVCTGAQILAAAGLLDGRRATTHWAWTDDLAQRHPQVDVEPDRIYVRDGDLITSAGVTAGMDLALALVEDDHGPKVARTVARHLVMFVQRPGGQSQFSERLAMPAPRHPTLRAVLDAVVAEPAADHRLETLAALAAMSERHLSRVFAAELRTTPARFVERVRVEAAREALEHGYDGVEVVARRCGFSSAEVMRRAFLRVLGVAPAQYRARFATTTKEAA